MNYHDRHFLIGFLLVNFIVGFSITLFSFEVMAAAKSQKTVSTSMVVIDKLAAELLESLDPKSRVAIRPFSKKETGIPEKLGSSLINGLVGSLQRQTNHKMNVVEREKLLKIWQEAEEFKNADLSRLVKEAGADILIIGDVRTRKEGLELSFRAYDTRPGNTGKIVASTRLHYLEMNWKTETGFSPEQSAKAIQDMSKALRILMSSGGLVAAPKAPADFYHNARILAQRGELDRAVASYKKLFKFKVILADAVKDLVSLASALYGKFGAHKLINEILLNQKSLGLLYYARQLLSDKPVYEIGKGVLIGNLNYMPAIME